VTSDLLVGEEESLRVLTLNRPDRRNALTAESYRLLADALRAADADASVKVVLLRGAGRGFCSGVDLEALAANGPDGPLAPAFDALLDALVEVDVVLVGAVHGAAIGVGATMLAHLDYVVAAEDARFRYPFAPMGLLPEGASSWTLPHLVGLQRATEILLSGRFVSGVEAARLGLTAECCPAELVEGRAREVVAGFLEHDREVLRSTKRLLRAPRRAEIVEALRAERAETSALGRRRAER
jgi:enoyl-CoA hydratase/carnithine racemase